MPQAHMYTPYVSASIETMMRKQDVRMVRMSGFAPTFGQMFVKATRSVLEGLAQWNRKRKIANEMYELSDHMLADIGLNRFDIPRVAAESARIKSSTKVAQGKVAASQTAKIVPFAVSDEAEKVTVASNDDALKVA